MRAGSSQARIYTGMGPIMRAGCSLLMLLGVLLAAPGCSCCCWGMLPAAPSCSCCLGCSSLPPAARATCFTLGTPGGVRVCIVGFPKLCSDPAYMAHLANDPVGDARSEKEYYARLPSGATPIWRGCSAGSALLCSPEIASVPGRRCWPHTCTITGRCALPPITKRKP